MALPVALTVALPVALTVALTVALPVALTVALLWLAVSGYESGFPSTRIETNGDTRKIPSATNKVPTTQWPTSTAATSHLCRNYSVRTDMHNLVFWILGARSQLRDGPSMIVPSHQATHHIKKSCSQQLFLALFRIYTYRYLDLNSICECPCTDTLRSGTSEVWPSVTGTVLTWLCDKSITSRCTSLWKQTG